MVKQEIINGKIFITQTTYYIYSSEPDLQNDHAYLITSDKAFFLRHKKREKRRSKIIQK